MTTTITYEKEELPAPVTNSSLDQAQADLGVSVELVNNNDDNNDIDENEDGNDDIDVNEGEERESTNVLFSSTNRNGLGVVQTSATSNAVTRDEKREYKKLQNDLDNLQDLIDEMKAPSMDYIDIVQLTAILLMPTIAKYGEEWKEKNEQPPKDANSQTNEEDPVNGNGDVTTAEDPMEVQLHVVRRTEPTRFA